MSLDDTSEFCLIESCGHPPPPQAELSPFLANVFFSVTLNIPPELEMEEIAGRLLFASAGVFQQHAVHRDAQFLMTSLCNVQ